MALSGAAAGSSPSRAPDILPGLEDAASVTETTSEYRTIDNSGIDSSFVKSISQNYNVDEVRKLLNEIYCSTVLSLNLEVIQVWLRVVQNIRAFLLAHEGKHYFQLYSKSMHLRLTTCWNEILYAIIGHVRHAPNVLGQTFQKSAGNKQHAIYSCIACFCNFCSEVGVTWNKGVSDILALLRDMLSVLRDNCQDSSVIEAWIRQAEESQVNIAGACGEFQESFSVLASLVDDEQVPSEAVFMNKLYSVCTGDMRQSLEADMISQLHDDVLMSERCVASAAVLQAKTTVLKAWNDTVTKLLGTFMRAWTQESRLTISDVYITALESFHGAWARTLCSVMVATDLLEGDFIRAELERSTVKAVQAGIIADLSHETDLIRTPRLDAYCNDDAGATPPTEAFPLGNCAYWYKNWLLLAQAVEQSVQTLGDLLARQDRANKDQALLSRLYQGAANCLERYEQACCLLRHFALYEANTTTCTWELSRACDKIQQALVGCLGAVGFHQDLPSRLQRPQKDLAGIKRDLLSKLKDLRKERTVPDAYVTLFRSLINDWLRGLELAVSSIRQDALTSLERARADCSDLGKLDKCVAALPSCLEEGYQGVAAVVEQFCANESWRINDISILARLSSSRSKI